MGILAITLMVGAASFATAGVPDLNLSTAGRAYLGPETAVMFNVPNGGGSAFSAASIIGGTVDATVTLTLLDGAGAPIANFPFEDSWLVSADAGMVPCIGGTTSDANTDAAGVTQWVTPLAAGGSSQALTVVMIAGAALTSGAGVAISHNSPDLNGDGSVNLSDLAGFASDFYTNTTAFRTDFAFAGAVNLSDLAVFASTLGAACP